MDRGIAVLSLIAEMQAKLNNPDSERLTKELATLTLESIIPMVKNLPKVQPRF